MCVRLGRPPHMRWVWIVLVLVSCAPFAGCLGPGLEPPDGDNASGEQPRGPAADAGQMTPTGTAGTGASAAGSGGAAVPGAGASGNGSRAGNGGEMSDTPDGGMDRDAGIDDEDAGATH